MGHPEFNLNIKPSFLFKDFKNHEYNLKHINQKLVLLPAVRLRNFKVCIILEIIIFDIKQNKRITYANKKFFKDNPNIDAIFKDERKEFYDNLVNEFNIIKNIEIFKDIKIDNIKNRNLMLTKFSWDEVLELNLKDFKKFILKLQESLENVAIKLNYKKQW